MSSSRREHQFDAVLLLVPSSNEGWNWQKSRNRL